jgi:transposase
VGEGKFAGIDWASREHAVCVNDSDGRIVEGRRYRHAEGGLRALGNGLVELGVLLVAVERPDGLLIEGLLDCGLHVIAIHPHQVAAMRPRFSAAGGKSDSFDSFVLAELARTDSHRFRVLVPDSDATKAMRALTRAREDLVEHRVAIANALRAQLECFWPGAVAIFADIDSPIALAFLRRYPSPADARGLGEQRLERFLARNHYCGRRPARELLARPRGAADGRADTLETEARRQIVLALVAALEPIVTRIAELTSEIRSALHDHPDGQTFHSLFRDPKTAICPASMLAEIGDCRDRYPTVAALADTSRHTNPWAADIDHRARARGATHQHATRIPGRAWCGVIWRIWHHHSTHDPNLHHGLQRLITHQGRHRESHAAGSNGSSTTKVDPGPAATPPTRARRWPR